MEQNREVVGEALVLGAGVRLFDVSAYHDNGDIDIYIDSEGIGVLTVVSGFWLDTKAAHGFIDEIKDIFAKKGIKVVKNGNL